MMLTNNDYMIFYNTIGDLIFANSTCFDDNLMSALADAVTFLKRIKDTIEDPSRLLLEV